MRVLRIGRFHLVAEGTYFNPLGIIDSFLRPNNSINKHYLVQRAADAFYWFSKVSYLMVSGGIKQI